MYKEPVFLKPFFQERIWGGTKLKTLFNYDIPTSLTGEAWVISAHENGPSTVLNGLLEGKFLSEVWRDYPDLFGNKNPNKEFPLLIKILDANDKLSVQVHPDDKQAQEIAGQANGKTECWYILDCEEGAEIIIGHKAQSQEEFQGKVEKEEWQELFQSIKVQKGDFVYVPSGTVHSIGKGIVILETQQSSDLTYRLYDYNRCNERGEKRELHLKEAISVITYPYKRMTQETLKENKNDLISTRLIVDKNFCVYHWQLSGKVEAPLNNSFFLASVIHGEGIFSTSTKKIQIKKGDHFILPITMKEYFLEGELEFIVSHP